MAKRRRSGPSNQKPTKATGSSPKLPKAAETIGFTDAEQAFFRTGDDSGMLALAAEREEPEQPRTSFWRRLFLLSPS
jgi:hypothetical protein